MKVKCLKCGLVYGIERCWKQSCPQCGEVRYVMKLEDFEKIPDSPKEDSSMVSLAKEFLRVVKEEGIKIVKKEGIPDETMMGLTMKARDKRDKEEGLAFEIFDIKDGNKIRSRKIYLNSHIEGFKGDPCIINHIAPKILALKAFVKQINKDYRDLIEAYMGRGLPLDNVSLHELYLKEMERINNIKI